MAKVCGNILCGLNLNHKGFFTFSCHEHCLCLKCHDNFLADTALDAKCRLCKDVPVDVEKGWSKSGETTCSNTMCGADLSKSPFYTISCHIHTLCARCYGFHGFKEDDSCRICEQYGNSSEKQEHTRDDVRVEENMPAVAPAHEEYDDVWSGKFTGSLTEKIEREREALSDEDEWEFSKDNVIDDHEVIDEDIFHATEEDQEHNWLDSGDIPDDVLSGWANKLKNIDLPMKVHTQLERSNSMRQERGEKSSTNDNFIEDSKEKNKAPLLEKHDGIEDQYEHSFFDYSKTECKTEVTEPESTDSAKSIKRSHGHKVVTEAKENIPVERERKRSVHFMDEDVETTIPPPSNNPSLKQSEQPILTQNASDMIDQALPKDPTSPTHGILKTDHTVKKSSTRSSIAAGWIDNEDDTLQLFAEPITGIMEESGRARIPHEAGCLWRTKVNGIVAVGDRDGGTITYVKECGRVLGTSVIPNCRAICCGFSPTEGVHILVISHIRTRKRYARVCTYDVNMLKNPPKRQKYIDIETKGAGQLKVTNPGQIFQYNFKYFGILCNLSPPQISVFNSDTYRKLFQVALSGSKIKLKDWFDTVCVSPDGNIFIASFSEQKVYQYDNSGEFICTIGSPGNDEGTIPGSFYIPCCIIAEALSAIVVVCENGQIHRYENSKWELLDTPISSVGKELCYVEYGRNRIYLLFDLDDLIIMTTDKTAS